MYTFSREIKHAVSALTAVNGIFVNELSHITDFSLLICFAILNQPKKSDRDSSKIIASKNNK